MKRIFAVLLTVASMVLPAAAAEIGDDGLHKETWMRDTFLDLGEDLEEARAEGKRPQDSPADCSQALSIGRLSEALKAAQKAYLDALSGYTIADLAATPPGDLGLSGAPTIGSQLH